MLKTTSDETGYADLPDEELAALCTDGIDAAERELLRRHMQAIYWLPRRAFGAEEDELSGFLIFAVEKLRERDIFAKYDRSRGAKFTTWLGVVLKRLYLDYLRTDQEHTLLFELDENADAPDVPVSTPDNSDSILSEMEIRCRTIFKLLLCDSFFLDPEEIQWIAQSRSDGIIETARDITLLEESQREKDSAIDERYDHLAIAYWWKNRYEKQLLRIEHEIGTDTGDPRYENTLRKLEKKRAEYQRLAEELSGMSGIATASYKDLADLLKIKEGTLASQISRCRAGAAELLRKKREGGTQ